MTDEQLLDGFIRDHLGLDPSTLDSAQRRAAADSFGFAFWRAGTRSEHLAAIAFAEFGKWVRRLRDE